jgi:outer membrane protein assembly factor BamB
MNLSNIRTFLIWSALLLAVTLRAETPSETDWPQFRGPTRDGQVLKSPKLLDTWPKEGPPQVWVSEWIPGCEEGGCGSPVVVGGKVFLYVNAKNPVGGGKTYRPITTELLTDAGWLPDLPDTLAQKIEEAWASPNRPSSKGWSWWDIDWAKEPNKDKELDEFLAKKPELEKYIKDFTATLYAEDSKKYSTYIKRRFCMELIQGKLPYGGVQALTWAQLQKLSELRTFEKPYARECIKGITKHVEVGSGYPSRSFLVNAWMRSYKMTDTLICLDASSGKTLWRTDFPEDPSVYRDKFWDFGSGHYAILGACGTPTITNGKCYFAGANGLYCLSASDGKLVWQVKGLPEHAAPLVADGIVYHCGVAYNAETGAIAWKHPGWKEKRTWGYARWSSPLLWKTGGKSCVITTDGDAKQCCLELATGKEMWKVNITKTPHDPFSGLNRVVIHGDLLVGDGQAYKMTATSAEPLCKIPAGLSVVHQDYLYSVVDGGDGQKASLQCLDLKTGEAKWVGKWTFGDGAIVAPILVDGKILMTLGSCHRSLGGLKPHRDDWVGDWAIQMVKPSPTEPYVELGLFQPKYMCPITSPAISDGRMYLRMDNAVACYDLRAK